MNTSLMRRLPVCASVLFLVVVLFATAVFAQNVAEVKPVLLRPDKPLSWWFVGDVVNFKTAPNAPLPVGVQSIEGQVTTINEKVVARVTVPRSQFEAEGWKWKPEAPGYYEIEFFQRNAAGERTLVTEIWWRQAPNKVKGKFERKKFNVAVTLPPTVKGKPIGQFGFHYHLNLKEIPMAALIGYDFAFIHSIPWGNYFTNRTLVMEPERGVYKWDLLDPHVDALVAANVEIGAQFLYTPVWASPAPERSEEIAVCVPVSAAFAPAKMEDFTNFVSKTVERYKDRIKIWEIWNEPNLPGSSCFWFDTPENYVRMLKAGYETVKKVQPEAEVWNGGLGTRRSYHAFYDRILRGGAAPYFDKLSLHAISTDVDEFRRIEKANQAPHRPAVVTEWHAILVGNMSNEFMASEAKLSLRMMKDQLLQLKQGVVKTVIFEMSNQNEKETVNFAITNKWFTHSSGLFRISPRTEPRHAAVVMANFLRVTGKKATFVREIQIGKSGIALLLNTAQGPILAFWSEGDPIAMGYLKVVRTGKSTLVDWEGKTLEMTDNVLLEPNQIYYLTAPDEAAISRLPASDLLIPKSQQIRAALHTPSASYYSGRLFQAQDKELVPKGTNVPWIDQNWKWVPFHQRDKEGLSSRAQVGLYEDGLDLLVEVQDSKHVQSEKEQWWNGDSLQFAVDCEGRGIFGSSMEVLAALRPDGVVFWKISTANAGADLPSKMSAAGGPVQFGECKISRDGSKTIYRIRLPWSELYPMAFTPDREIKVSLLVNNNDGDGRGGFLEWAGGIGGPGEKDPAAYGTLKPLGKSK